MANAGSSYAHGGISIPPTDEDKWHVNNNRDAYCYDLKHQLQEYREKHTPDWYQSGTANEEMTKAWQMYTASRESSLVVLLLGKGEIRFNPNMITNFGYTSAHGAEEGRPSKLAWESTLQRKTVRQTKELHNGTLGPGSILSDRDWSPMLNDAFILGGVHGDRQFELALSQLGDDDIEFPAQLVDKYPELFWPEGQPYPAVLLRELIGLRAFGFTPHWGKMGLTFSCTKPAKGAP